VVGSDVDELLPVMPVVLLPDCEPDVGPLGGIVLLSDDLLPDGVLPVELLSDELPVEPELVVLLPVEPRALALPSTLSAAIVCWSRLPLAVMPFAS